MIFLSPEEILSSAFYKKFCCFLHCTRKICYRLHITRKIAIVCALQENFAIVCTLQENVATVCALQEILLKSAFYNKLNQKLKCHSLFIILFLACND